MGLFGLGMHRPSGSPRVQRIKESCNRALDRLDYRRKHARKKSRVDWRKAEDRIRARCDREILAAELAEERKEAQREAKQHRAEQRKAMAEFRREKAAEKRAERQEAKERRMAEWEREHGRSHPRRRSYSQREALDMLMGRNPAPEHASQAVKRLEWRAHKQAQRAL